MGLYTIRLGQKIRQERKAMGWDQVDLAIKMRVSQVTISHWELSKTKPSTKHRKKLHEVFRGDQKFWMTAD